MRPKNVAVQVFHFVDSFNNQCSRSVELFVLHLRKGTNQNRRTIFDLRDTG